MTTEFQPTPRTQVRRKPHRGSYDRDVVFAILDAGMVAHIAYRDGDQPVCTPTTYWREGDSVYWHGAAAGRALAAQAGQPVCFTVSHVDGLVLARSGFTHSMLYRSVMAFGRPERIDDAAQKRRALDAFLDRLYPGRSAEIRPAHEGEIAALAVMRMPLEKVSAKVREPGVLDRDADLAAPCWAGTVTLAVTVREIVADPRVPAGTPLPHGLARYREGGTLEETLPGQAPARAAGIT